MGNFRSEATWQEDGQQLQQHQCGTLEASTPQATAKSPISIPTQKTASFADHVPRKHGGFGWIFHGVFHGFSCSECFGAFEELKEKLWALAERRPAEATKLMGQAFAGKKSLGEMASAPQTSDPNLKLGSFSLLKSD